MTEAVLSATGIDDTDTQLLQSALDAAVSSPKRIVLRGGFVVNKPLVMYGQTTLGGDGASIAYSYRAPATNDSILSLQKHASQVNAYASHIEGVDFYCNRRCRGVRVAEVTSTEVLRDIRVYDSIGIGLDLWDCWGSSIHNVTLAKCNGVAMRTHRCNHGLFERVAVLNCRLFKHVDKAKDMELVKYVAENGIAAARKKYGTDCQECWTTDVDEQDRAALVIDEHQDLSRFNGLRFEPLVCGDFPAISCRAKNTTFSQLYFEAGHFSQVTDSSVIHVKGTSGAGSNTRLEQVRFTANSQPDFLVKLTGAIENMLIDGVYVYSPPHGITRGLIRQVGTRHVGTEVLRYGGHKVMEIVGDT